MQKIFETISLFLLLGMVALRPLIAESYDSSVDSISGALQGIDQPLPLVTLLFDLAILAATLGWLISRVVVKQTRVYSKTGLEWGGIVVLIAAILSCVFAGNQRLAINGAIDWLCFPLMAIVFVQLMHRQWHRTLLLSVVFASGFAQTVECFDQYNFGFADTWEHYESIKEDFWAQQGVDLSDSKVTLFENRILSHEASGFMPHSNIAGSYLVLCAFAAIGVLIARIKHVGNNPEPQALACADQPDSIDVKWILVQLGLIIATIAISVALVLTKSLGTYIAVGAGILLSITLYGFRNWIAKRRRQSVLIGWGLLLLGIIAVVGHGWYHDSLPGWSLTFRWQYWRNSAGMIADHPLTGVGRENFGRHYLQYKSIDSPEEVSNPHNLFVQAAADWGIPGLIGLLLMLFGASFYVTRPIPQTSGSSHDVRGPPSKIANLGWTFGLMIVVVIVRMPLLGSDDPSFLYFKTMLAALPWLVMFLCSVSLIQTSAIQSVEGRRIMRMAVALGLFAFLIHDMINFALFVPATATTFFALLAYCLSLTSENDVENTEPHASACAVIQVPKSVLVVRACPIGVILVAVVIVLYFGVIPVSLSSQDLQFARQSAASLAPVSLSNQVAVAHFDRAAADDPFDSTPLIEKAQWLMAMMQNPAFREDAFLLADHTLTDALRRDPHDLKICRLHTLLYQQRSQTTKNKEDYRKAIDNARAAMKIYPQDPQGLAVLADCYFEGGVETDDAEWIRQAAIQYQNALELDDQRLKWEKLQRFSKKHVDYIQERLQEAKKQLQNNTS